MDNKRPYNEATTLSALLEVSMLTPRGARQINALLQANGITYYEYQVLNYLHLNVEGTEPSKIADKLCIFRQTMTNLIDSLQEKGYVERVPHPSDRRKMLIKLLPEGVACITLANGLIHKLFASIINKFPQGEIDRYFDIHNQIIYYIENEIDAQL